MFFKPKWYKKLPLHLRPDNNKVENLESLRRKLGFPDEIFFMGIVNSRWTVIQAQKATLETLKIDKPEATEAELWEGVLFTRLKMKLMMPTPDDLPRDEILHRMENVSNIVANIHSFDELLNYIISMDEKNLMDDDPTQRQIDEALFG
ncbi:MAG: hypothetical protein V1927_00565 [Candidatus Omnitrophota bacterium]